MKVRVQWWFGEGLPDRDNQTETTLWFCNNDWITQKAATRAWEEAAFILTDHDHNWSQVCVCVSELGRTSSAEQAVDLCQVQGGQRTEHNNNNQLEINLLPWLSSMQYFKTNI